MREPTEATQNGPPESVGVDWCHWHADRDDTTAPVQDIERKSSGPYRLFACASCRCRHKLEVLASAVEYCTRCGETVSAIEENRLDAIESMSGARPDSYAHRGCGRG